MRNALKFIKEKRALKGWMWIVLALFLLIPFIYDKGPGSEISTENEQAPAAPKTVRCNSANCPPGTSVAIELSGNPPQNISTTENQVYSAENLQGISFVVIQQRPDAPQDTAQLQAPGGAMYMVPWRLIIKNQVAAIQ